MDSFASGMYSRAQGGNSACFGHSTITQGDSQVAMGRYNIAQGTQYVTPTGTDNLLIIGNGDMYTRSNAFRFQFNGNAYGNQWNTSGADYAEMFEWADGNADAQDRRGYFVTLQGEKIRLATDTDKYILGVISATPGIIGDVAGNEWHGRYERDNFGEVIREWGYVEVADPDDNTQTKQERVLLPKVNPAYNGKPEDYIPRDRRIEWAAVGMMGKLIVRDDGSCKVDEYCKVGENGTATAANDENGYRVIKRIDENTIKIIFK